MLSTHNWEHLTPLKNQAHDRVRKMHLAKLLWKHIPSPCLALSKGYGYQISARTARCRRETIHVPVNTGVRANTHTHTLRKYPIYRFSISRNRTSGTEEVLSAPVLSWCFLSQEQLPAWVQSKDTTPPHFCAGDTYVLHTLLNSQHAQQWHMDPKHPKIQLVLTTLAQ